MVTPEEADALRAALEGKRLDHAPRGFRAALVGLFGIEDADSFALVDGDEDVVLGIREAGLLIITSGRDERYRCWTADARFVPFDDVKVEVQYRDHGVANPRHPPPATATVTIGDKPYRVTVDVAGTATPMSWVRALIDAKAGAARGPIT